VLNASADYVTKASTGGTDKQLSHTSRRGNNSGSKLSNPIANRWLDRRCAADSVRPHPQRRLAHGCGGARSTWLAIAALLSLGTLPALQSAIYRPWPASHVQTGLAWILPALMAALIAFGPVVGLAARSVK